MIKKYFLLSFFCLLLSNSLSAMSYKNSFEKLNDSSDNQSDIIPSQGSDKEKQATPLQLTYQENLSTQRDQTAVKATIARLNSLFTLARENKLSEIKEIVSQIKPSIKSSDERMQETFQHNIQKAFLQAAGYGHIKITDYLLEEGAELNLPDTHGTTALGHAAGKGLKDMVKDLLEKGADVNAGKKPPLVWATGNNHLECMDILFKYGASNQSPDINGLLPIHTAVIKGSIEALKKIITLAKENGELDEIINAQDTESDRTPLLWATRMSKNEHSQKTITQHELETSKIIVNLLLENGARDDLTDKTGKTGKEWQKITGLTEATISSNWRTDHRSKAFSSTTQLSQHRLCSNNNSIPLERKPGAYIPPSLRNK